VADFGGLKSAAGLVRRVPAEMHDDRQDNSALPLPKWCLVLLAVPTFYMPSVYLAMAVCVLGSMFSGRPLNLPAWLKPFLASSMGVTIAVWPIYVAWVALARRLTLREKGRWLSVVVFFNMLGMPLFYVFMIRRYLGVEARVRPSDEKALDRFLAGCGIGRDELSAGQMGVLRSYCRMHRLRKWAAITTAVLGALLLYSASYFTRVGIPMLSGMAPNRYILTARH
jgi:hypothetical protein